MNWAVAGTVLVKEIKETLRDRRTVMIMVVVPAFLYPAMFVLMEQLALLGQRNVEGDPVRVAVVGDDGSAFPLRSDSMLELVPAPGSAISRVRQGSLDAAIVYRPGDDGRFTSDRVRIIYDGTRTRSNYALAVIDERLDALRDTLLAERLEAEGLPESFAAPLVVSDTSVATPQRVGGTMLGRFLPMILILMTVLGAFYPSIDLAAGEKERGTLEPLLTAPVPADVLVMGKFAAVTVIALAAATLNLLSMLLTFQSGLFQLTQVLDVQFGMPLNAIVLVFFALTLLAVLFSSLFLGVAVRAHSFKEAQNSLTPIYTLSILPALTAMIPGIEFTPALAAMPVAGVSLLFRELLTGDADVLAAAIAVFSTLLYAMTALIFAVRAFGREEVLFGGLSDDAAPLTLGQRLRKWRAGNQHTPGASAALVFVSVIALLFFYLNARLVVPFGEQGIVLAQLLLLGLPALLFVRAGPYDARATFALRRPAVRDLVAAVLIVAGGLPIGWLLGWLQTHIVDVPDEFLGQLEGLLTADDPLRFAWLILLVALTPAICEELVFRGVLLQGLSKGMRMWGAVAVSALIFGAFHLSTATVIRFLPTAWMGLLLGYVVWQTRSLYASMLMHFLNNLVALLLVNVVALQTLAVTPRGEPRLWTIPAAAVLLFAGFRLLPKRSGGPGDAPTGHTTPDGVPDATTVPTP